MTPETSIEKSEYVIFKEEQVLQVGALGGKARYFVLTTTDRLR